MGCQIQIQPQHATSIPCCCCHLPKSSTHTYTHSCKHTLMQSHANTQTCPTLHLYTFYFLPPSFSLSSFLPSLLSGLSVFSSGLIMLTKPIKSLSGETGQCYSFISGQRHLQTQSREERRGQGGGGGKRQRGVKRRDEGSERGKYAEGESE